MADVADMRDRPSWRLAKVWWRCLWMEVFGSDVDMEVIVAISLCCRRSNSEVIGFFGSSLGVGFIELVVL
jgi:hypothetical protein